jgi:hypothetical protein
VVEYGTYFNGVVETDFFDGVFAVTPFDNIGLHLVVFGVEDSHDAYRYVEL